MVIFHGNHADFWPSKMDMINNMYIYIINQIYYQEWIYISHIYIYIYYDIKSDMTDTTDTTDMTDMTDAGLVMK